MTTKSHNPADKVEQWPIDKLIPYAKNSRTHSEEQVAQIAASIKEWGFTTAVLVDESGSGSTLMGAEKAGRVCYTMELQGKYCDVIVKRWQDFTGKIATHAETGEPFAEVKDGNKESKT